MRKYGSASEGQIIPDEQDSTEHTAALTDDERDALREENADSLPDPP